MSRFDGCKSLTTWPPIRISPELIDSRPAIVLSRVDLPQPDGPTSTRKPPCSSEMSMPLRISRLPNRLRSARISRVAIGLSFHCAGHQAAHEIASGEDVNDESRRRGDDRGRHVDVVFNNTGRGVDDVVERDRHRTRVASGEGRAEQKVVPNVGELIDDRYDEDGRRVRQQNAAKNLEEACSVNLRRLDELGRKRLVVVAEKERREAEAVDHVDEHEINGRVPEPPREAGRIDKRLP